MRRSLSQPILQRSESQSEQDFQKSVSQIEKLNVQCSICKDVLLFPCTLACGHSFCYKCLKDLHSHSNNRRYYDSDESDEGSDVEEPQQPQSQSTGTQRDTYRKVFFNDRCFRTVLSGKSKDSFSSNLMLDKNRLITHILQDTVFGDKCNGLKCPTCRVKIKVVPKPNILLHETLQQLLGDLYENRLQEYLSNYAQDFILDDYERSERFRTIKLLVTESIQSIEQAVSFKNLMDSFSAYGEIEIVWCLNKLLKDRTFIIVKDIIISNEHYSSDFSKLLASQRVTSDDINYLIVSHPHFSLGDRQRDSNLINSLKKRFKGVRTGVLGMIDNEEQLNESMRECIVTNNLLNW